MDCDRADAGQVFVYDVPFGMLKILPDPIKYRSNLYENDR